MENKTITPTGDTVNTKLQFLTETIDLPSKGLLYDQTSVLSSGNIQMKYGGAKEEDILTNQSYLKNGIAIEKLIESVVVTPGFNIEELLVGDKNALTVAARVLMWGKDYNIKYTPPGAEFPEDVTIDLIKCTKDKMLDESLISIKGKNEFGYELPITGKLVTFKLLTVADNRLIDEEARGYKKINAQDNWENRLTLIHMILSIDGNYEKSNIRELINKGMIPARDTKALRDYSYSIEPNSEIKFDYKKNGYTEEGIEVGYTTEFFWPKS